MLTVSLVWLTMHLDKVSPELKFDYLNAASNPGLAYYPWLLLFGSRGLADELPGLNLEHARLLRQLDRLDRATELLRENLEHAPNDSPVFCESALLLAEILAERGEAERAGELLVSLPTKTVDPLILARDASKTALTLAERNPVAARDILVGLLEKLAGPSRLDVLIALSKIELKAGHDAAALDRLLQAKDLATEPAQSVWLDETIYAIRHGEHRPGP